MAINMASEATDMERVFATHLHLWNMQHEHLVAVTAGRETGREEDRVREALALKAIAYRKAHVSYGPVANFIRGVIEELRDEAEPEDYQRFAGFIVPNSAEARALFNRQRTYTSVRDALADEGNVQRRAALARERA